jgi:hypothetical protein
VDITSSITKKICLKTNDGLSSFKNHACQQHHGIFQVFYDFFKGVKPSNVLEIGTALGGFTMFMKIISDELGLNTSILSYDIHRNAWYGDMINEGVDVRVENVFSEGFADVNQEVKDFINKDGTTIVLCDGGYKQGEFNLLSKFIKQGDFILAHDYGESKEIFDNKIFNNIWNWCEITESEIANACKDNNLIDFDKETFNNVAWTCKVRTK